MEKRNDHCTAVLLAGGQGKRMGQGKAKQYLEIAEKPVLWYSLMAIEKSEYIDECVLVIRPEDIDFVREELLTKYYFTKVTRLAFAGKERYESVWSALVSLTGIDWTVLNEEKKLEVLEDVSVLDKLPTDYIFIHDGARPFLTEEILKNNYLGVKEYGACVTGVMSKDTIKLVGEDGYVKDTPDRSRLRIVQTPQTFRAPLIYEAYRKALFEEIPGITDDAMTVELSNLSQIHMVEGSYSNIKITTPEDLLIAEILAN